MSMSTPKRRKDSHRVSDSDDGDADSDGETSSVGGFGDPNAFLNKFGGYASDGSESEPDQGEHLILKLLLCGLYC
jgi:hypothetical protein